MYHLEHFNSIAQNLCFQGDNKFGNFNAVASKQKSYLGIIKFQDLNFL